MEKSLSGFEQGQQAVDKKISTKLPDDKAEFVKAYGVLINKKKAFIAQGEDVPYSLTEELQVWDSAIYKRFTPIERKLIHQQALMSK
jgi:hypothetical protein